MNKQLKSVIETSYVLCDALEKSSTWDKSVNGRAREFFRSDLFHFLLNLSFVDGKITSAERDFIKYYLGFDYSMSAMRQYAIANKIYSVNYTNQVPYVFKAFVKSDQSKNPPTDRARLILSLYKQLGTEFLKVDGDTQNENYNLNLYISNMEKYMGDTIVDAVNLTLDEISNDLSGLNLTNLYNSAPGGTIKPTVTDSPFSTGPEYTREPVKEETPKEPEKTLDELMNELNELVGLEKVKNDVHDLINLVKIRKIREERGMKNAKMSLHMVFSGNPGTGKTTIARLLAEIYKAMGLLSKGHLTEVDRSGLVGGYVGQTAIKVKEVCDKAKGGVLFIDEAYSLTVNRGSTDYGFEAVDTLLKYMEDNRDDFICIVAGYTEPMEEFMNSNPGLKSRFNKFIFFEDYTPEELIGILKMQAKKSGLTIDDEGIDYATQFFTERCENKPRNYANARDVRNFFEKSLVNQANRLAVIDNLTDDDLITLKKSDFEKIKL